MCVAAGRRPDIVGLRPERGDLLRNAAAFSPNATVFGPTGHENLAQGLPWEPGL
jgi:hypothetical protein